MVIMALFLVCVFGFTAMAAVDAGIADFTVKIPVGNQWTEVSSTAQVDKIAGFAKAGVNIILKERTEGGLNKRAMPYALLFSPPSVFPN